MNHSLVGTGVAIVTPFQQGEVDYTSLEKIINHLIDGGVQYIVSLGTTGESATLSMEEKEEVIQETIRLVDNRIPVVVGCGGNNTKAVIESMHRMASWADFDTFLSVSPAYNKPSQEGIYQHYKAIAESTDKDIILYNVPGRTAKNIEPSTMIRLANNLENIIGVKEAGDSIKQSMLLAQNKPDDFLLISGDDDLIFPQMSLGFDGVISVVANAYPAEWSNLIRLMKQSKIDEARAIAFELHRFVNLIFTENNPAGIKCALHAMKLCKNEFRLPIVPVNLELENQIHEFVNKFSDQE